MRGQGIGQLQIILPGNGNISWEIRDANAINDSWYSKNIVNVCQKCCDCAFSFWNIWNLGPVQAARDFLQESVGNLNLDAYCAASVSQIVHATLELTAALTLLADFCTLVNKFPFGRPQDIREDGKMYAHIFHR